MGCHMSHVTHIMKFFMLLRRQFYILSGILPFLSWLSLSVQAQNNQNMNPQESQIQTQELYEKNIFAPLKPKSQEEKDWDKEFGRLFELTRPKPWSITPYASSLGFWTTNARLSRTAEKEDWVLVQRQGININYRIDENWRVATSYSFEMIRYDGNVNLDTNAHIPEFYTSYRLPWNWNVTIGDRGTWLDSPRSDTQIYRENHPYFLLTQSHSYFNHHLYWSYGFQYDRRFTHPVSFDRNEYTVFTGISHDWTPKLISQFVLRQNWQFYDFRSAAQPVNGRQEWNSSGILQTIWQPFSWLQLTGFAMAVYDNSINSTFDYKVANVGGEVRFSWKF